MTALTIPPEVAAECSQKLLALAATASRDAMTLTKQALVLARNDMPSRAFATLKKYVREYNQYESGEVAKIVATIEAAADPKHIARLKQRQAKYDAQRANFEEACSEKPPTYWEFPAVRAEAAKHQGGNVVAGPWDAAGRAGP